MIVSKLIVDDFFNEEDLKLVLVDAANYEYYNSSNHPDSIDGALNWSGVRSRNILHENNPRYSDVMNKIIIKSIHKSFGENPSKFNFSWDGHMYFHKLNDTFNETWMHRDNDTLFAGVIYLGEHPKPNSGTSMMTVDGIYNFDNKFNRMIMYNGNEYHSPQDGYDGRLTLTFFISCFSLTFWNEVKHNISVV